MKTTLPASHPPNHIEIRGTQAKRAIWRCTSSTGSSKRFMRRENPIAKTKRDSGRTATHETDQITLQARQEFRAQGPPPGSLIGPCGPIPIRPPLRRTSRLIVDGDRPNRRAIERSEQRVLSPLEISSRSLRLSAWLARFRAAGRIPPVGEITEKTDEDSRSNRRPIELIDSPACQRSQISDR